RRRHRLLLGTDAADKLDSMRSPTPRSGPDVAEPRGVRRRFRSDTATRLRLDGPGLVIMLAACMGLSALAIDLLLPAFSDLRPELGLAAGSTRISLII